MELAVILQDSHYQITIYEKSIIRDGCCRQWSCFGQKNKAVQFIPPPLTDSPKKAEAPESIPIEDSKKCFVSISEVQKDAKVAVTETR